MTATKQHPRAIEAHARAILSDLREWGSVTPEWIRQTRFISGEGYINDIILLVVKLGNGAVERTPKNCLIWTPAPNGERHKLAFEDDAPVTAAQEAERYQRRNEYF